MNSFGGKHNKFIIDPFADQWYLDWAHIWYNDSINAGDTWPEYITIRFQEKLSSLDLTQEQDKNDLADYLAEYCTDIIETLFIPDDEESGRYLAPILLEDISFSPEFIVDIYSIDQDIDEYTWITNMEFLQDQIESLLPYSEVNLEIAFNNLNDYPTLNESFWNSITSGDDSLLLNGTSFLLETPSTDVDEFEITLFIGEGLDIDCNMSIVSVDRRAVIAVKSDDLLDGTIQIHGMSEWILESVVDLLGLKSSKYSNGFISSYSKGLAGWLTHYGQYSKFEKSSISRMFIDQFDSIIRTQFLNNLSTLPEEIPSKTQRVISDSLRTLRYATSFLISHDPASAYRALLSMNNWTHRIFASLTDDLRPEFLSWNFTKPTSPNDSFLAWANISETDSGLENASFVVTRSNYETKHLLKSNGSLYVTTIPPLRFNATFDVYVEAFDWATNRAESFSVTIDLRPGEPPPLDPWTTAPIVILGSGSILLVVLVIALIYDRRQSLE
jgi:hypothetical protein